MDSCLVSRKCQGMSDSLHRVL